jgi:anti-sigma B factor antagonist
MYAARKASNASPPSSTAFAITEHTLDDGVIVLAVAGELDLSSAPSLKWALTDVLSGGSENVLVDLTLVTFLDSTALGVLVGVQRRLTAGRRLAIICANAKLLEIVELTGLIGTFELFSTLEPALAYARGNAGAAS